jgi:uncharacterized protein (DUF1330 family)
LGNQQVQKEGTVKKGYWVVAYRSISDEPAVKAYAALAVPAVQSFGGRFLTRSTSQVQAHAAGLQQRTIIVEFDSYDIAPAAHESDRRSKPQGSVRGTDSIISVPALSPSGG